MHKKLKKVSFLSKCFFQCNETEPAQLICNMHPRKKLYDDVMGYSRNIFMCGISSTNLVNKEVSVQAKPKIDLSKLRHYFFFQRKLRVHTLQIWKRWPKREARGKPILVWNSNSNSIFFIFTNNFKLKLALPWPPFGPPFPNS